MRWASLDTVRGLLREARSLSRKPLGTCGKPGVDGCGQLVWSDQPHKRVRGRIYHRDCVAFTSRMQTKG